MLALLSGLPRTPSARIERPNRCGCDGAAAVDALPPARDERESRAECQRVRRENASGPRDRGDRMVEREAAHEGAAGQRAFEHEAAPGGRLLRRRRGDLRSAHRYSQQGRQTLADRRLRQIRHRPHPGGGLDVLGRLAVAHEHDTNGRMHLRQALSQAEAVLTRQPDVDERNVRQRRPQQLQSGGGVSGRPDDHAVELVADECLRVARQTRHGCRRS